MSSGERTYEFEVDVSTYDLLRRGVLVADRRWVQVLGSSYVDASRRALELAVVDGALPVDVCELSVP